MKMERALLVAAVFGLAAVQFFGCSSPANPSTTEGTTSSSSGAGGAGGSGGGNGGSGGSGGSVTPPECSVDADCTNQGPVDFCGQPKCDAGKCMRTALQPPGTPLPSQKYGDCQESQCDATANIASVPLDTDVYDDANDCTKDECMNGTPSNTALAEGDLCNGQAGVCTAAGACVQCLDGQAGCGAQTCVMNKCVPSTCTNGMKNAGEGDIDCGGSCVPCADGKTCTNSTQCASGVCMGGMCATPTCMDGAKNGTETGFDCGGVDCSSSKCPTDESCKVAGDCQSGVCISGFCAEPKCTDAVQNGDEAGVDCGGLCEASCP